MVPVDLLLDESTVNNTIVISMLFVTVYIVSLREQVLVLEWLIEYLDRLQSGQSLSPLTLSLFLRLLRSECCQLDNTIAPLGRTF